MAGISVGGGHGGKKSVDSDIPLVPFIDLLLCCVMFLLVTAVWNQLARIDANQQQPGQAADQPPPEEKIKVILQVQGTGYVLASTAGERVEIPKAADKYDVDQLRERLQERKKLEPNRRDLVVAPEDGVMYTDVVEAMDTVVGEGFPDMSLSDGSTL
jgi:biopolymer transport protein ExbD